MSGTESLDLAEKVIHPPILRRICPSVKAPDGLIRELRRIYPQRIALLEMSSVHVDIERVKKVLRDATKEGGDFSRRGLSKAAGLDRDAVYDIISGRNKNPTVATLASLAEALGGDLGMFGLSRTLVVSEERLRAELESALPRVPREEGYAGQAEYLASALAGVLGLPKTDAEGDRKRPSRSGRPSKGQAPASPKD